MKLLSLPWLLSLLSVLLVLLALAAGCSGLGRGVDMPTAEPTAGLATAGLATAGPTGSASSAPAAASSSTTDAPPAVEQAATDLTRRRVDALAARDRAAWMATLADGAEQFRTDQGALFDRMVRLPLARLSTLDVEVAPRPGDLHGQVWVANLRLAYRLVGYDRGERAYSVSYLLSQTPAGWRFSAVGPGTNDPQPFDLPDVALVSSASTLVLGDVPVATLRTYLALGDTAHGRIAAVWGEALPAVIVVPKSVDELAIQLRSSTDRLRQVGAVTDGPILDESPALTDRVYINPDAPLSAVGRQAVVTHELTHVTVRGTTVREVPPWLAEGFADEVGLRASGVPVRTLAADLLAQVRAGKGPTALPAADAFNPATSTIEPAYTAAWLAVDHMRQSYGDQRVVAFYRAVSGTPKAAPPLGGTTEELTRAAFHDVLGTSEDAFVAGWLAHLATLAH